MRELLRELIEEMKEELRRGSERRNQGDGRGAEDIEKGSGKKKGYKSKEREIK